MRLHLERGNIASKILRDLDGDSKFELWKKRGICLTFRHKKTAFLCLCMFEVKHIKTASSSFKTTKTTRVHRRLLGNQVVERFVKIQVDTMKNCNNHFWDNHSSIFVNRFIEPKLSANFRGITFFNKFWAMFFGKYTYNSPGCRRDFSIRHRKQPSQTQASQISPALPPSSVNTTDVWWRSSLQ